MNKEDFEHLKPEEALIVDIREADELDALPMLGGVTNIPMGKVFTEAAKGQLPKDKKIVAICKTGGRCEVLVQALKERGFDADYLEGGLVGLQEDK